MCGLTWHRQKLCLRLGIPGNGSSVINTPPMPDIELTSENQVPVRGFAAGLRRKRNGSVLCSVNRTLVFVRMFGLRTYAKPWAR